MRYTTVTCLVSVVFSMSAAGVFGQESDAPATPVTVEEVGDRVFSSPDPEKTLDLFNLLAQKAIQEELELSDAEKEGIKKIREEVRSEMREFVRSTEESGTDVRKALLTAMKERRQATADAVSELLTPERNQRLKELAYRVETSRIGLANALVFGRLGHVAGIYEGQKTNLIRRGEEILKEAHRDILEIRKRAEADLLKEVTPEQRKAVISAIGEFFEYREPNQFLSRLPKLDGESKK